MWSLWSVPFEKFSRLPVLQADLTGKHVLVSGGNSGLGAEAVKHFAQQHNPPASIHILCRNVKNGEKIAQKIKQETGYKGEIAVEAVDLCNFGSLKDFAERYNAKGQAADIVLMNAGIILPTFETSQDGHEKTLQTNILSPFLLPLLLRPSLEKSSAPRVTVTASAMSFYAATNGKAFQDETDSYISTLNDKANYSGPTRYNDSKLFEIMLARQFAKHFPLQKVTWTTVDPGYCMSSLDQNLPSYIYPLALAARWLFGRTTELGSRNLLWASIAGAKEGVDGRGTYISSCAASEVNPFLQSEKGKRMEERFYEQTVELFKTVASEAAKGL